MVPLLAAGAYAVVSALWIALWDAYLANAPLLSSLAGSHTLFSFRDWLLIGIGSAGIFVVLRLALRSVPFPRHDNFDDDTSFPVLRVVAIVFSVLTVAISATGFSVFLSFREQVVHTEAQEIAALTLLKRERISRWVDERDRDIKAVTINPFMVGDLYAWIVGNHGAGPVPERAAERIAILQRLQGFRVIHMFDLKGRLLHSVPDGPAARTVTEFERGVVAAALASGANVIDWAPAKPAEVPEIGLAAPIVWQAEGGQRGTIGVIYCEVDPNAYLLHLLSSWPVPSVSAEALLVHADGDWAYSFGRSAARNAQPTIQPSMEGAILAQLTLAGGFPDGVSIDDQGRRFIASAQRIPGTQWIVVGKENLEEIEAPLNRLAMWSGATASVALLIAAFTTLFAWRYQEATHIIARQRLRLDRAALVKHFDYLAKYANDGIALADEHGSIVEVNDRVLSDSGYPREAVLGMKVRDLIAPEARAQFDQDLEHTAAAGGIFETSLRRKDGSSVPVEVSARAVALENDRYMQCVLRDITERKQADRALRGVNRALTTLSAGNHAVVHAADEAQLLREMCRVIVEIGGYRLAWVGFAVDDEQKTVRPVAHVGIAKDYTERAKLPWADTESGRGPAGTAIRTQEPQVVQDAHTDPLYAPWRANAASLGYGAVLALPFSADGERGALCVYAAEIDAFGGVEIERLAELAEDLGYGIASMRVRAAHEQSYQRLLSSMERTIEAIAATVELRDAYTAGHQRRVAALATAIAQEIGIPDDEVRGIYLAGTIHDLGKIQIPGKILVKPARLTDLEFQLIKTHSRAGYDILKGIDFPWPIAQMVLQHHERMDGSGYPDGLKGEEIVIGARIIGVADTVEAMFSHRPYRPGLGIAAALAEVMKNRGKLYDPQAVDACVRLFREKGFEFPASAA